MRALNRALNILDYLLISLDNFLIVTRESDLESIRLVPPRLVEHFLFEEDDDDELEMDDEDEDDPEIGDPELEDPEDCEIDDNEVER